MEALHVAPGEEDALSSFGNMFVHGVQHIQGGTDHQLFLLTLLLVAPVISAGPRWAGPARARDAVRRIAGITLAFTIGHSATLALGTIGVPVPAKPVEALIAVSILVAAAHAIRPIFPGRETLVAAFFGLIHGLAFSNTLRELDLSGFRLGLTLLAFNLGIEAMQLAVVGLVLPPLILVARAGRYRIIRVAAASAAGVAATGWLLARVGLPNPVGDLADSIGMMSLPALVLLLWIAALLSFAFARGQDGTVAARRVK
jgi:hypothetical protein